MTQQSRRQMLIKAVHDAATELATRAGHAESATEYLDNKKPTPDEIRTFTGDYLDNADPDELWAAFAIDPENGSEHAGAGRTAAEAKTCAWAYSHWPGGTTSALVKVSTEVPDGWTFKLYPPPKPKRMIAVSASAIFELVRLTVPDVTPDEVEDTIMHSLPYMGGRRQ